MPIDPDELRARIGELEGELRRVREERDRLVAERPTLTFGQLGSQLAEALDQVRTERAGVTYVARTASFELRAAIDIDDEGTARLRFPRLGETVDPGLLTAVRVDLDAVSREEPDLGDLTLVPTVLGNTVDGARQRLEAAGLGLGAVRQRESVAPAGTVTAQDPDGGTYVTPGTTIDVTIAETPRVEVPDVVGNDLPRARQLLDEAQLRAGEITTEDADEPRGTVLAQSPEPGARLDAGGTVDLTVASGDGARVVVRRRFERTGPVPDVTGTARPEAVAAVEEGGWRVRVRSVPARDPERDLAPTRYDQVIDQDPRAGEHRPAGRAVVTLTVVGSPESPEVVHGIGSAYLSRLERAGLGTVGALAVADITEVAEALGVNEERAADLIAAARDHNDAYRLAAGTGLGRQEALVLVRGGDVRSPESLARRRADVLTRTLRERREEIREARGMHLTESVVSGWIEAARGT